FIDKAKHKAEEVIGDVKEKVGELTGNEELQAEGKKDQLSGNVKQTGDSVKDAASDIADKFTS
nr:CsbD family protein [Actinomycetota bacterium]